MSTSLGTPNHSSLNHLNHSTRHGATPEQRTAIKKYLNEWHQQTLSQHAQIVFVTVAHLLKDRKQESIWLGDAEVSRRARVLIQFIHAAQSELAKAGLMHMIPGENQTRYELITDEAAQ
jgi:hypothetical protein